MATVLDTHQAVKDLEAAGADPALAEAFVRVVQRGGEADLAQLATKTDLRAEVADLRGEMTELRGELRTAVADLKGEIARSKNGLLMWLLPLLFSQLGALSFLLLRLPH